MRSVQPILDSLATYDFVAHRERTAFDWANDFMAAASGSWIAAALYRDICTTLRSRWPIRWIELGGRALERVLPAIRVPWLEMHCDRVQPICWSNPGRFFEVGSPEEHERAFDASAIGYMLSNTTILRLEGHRMDKMTADGTFFNYLINKSLSSMDGPSAVHFGGDESHWLGTPQPMTQAFAQMTGRYLREGLESVSGPGSSLLQTSEIAQHLPGLIREIGASSLVDAGCGDFHWMSHVSLDVEEYIGIDLLTELIAENQRRFGLTNRRFLNCDFTRSRLPEADLILCRDCLAHFPYEDIFRALRNFKNSRSKYLLTTTFTNRYSNREIAIGDWQPLNLQLAPFNFPAPLKIIDEKCTELGNAYRDKSLALWRLDDIH
jgi:hypothetical protein